MHIVTSQNLFTKYPGNDTEIMSLLQALTPNVDVLPLVDYMSTKIHCDMIEDSILLVGGPDVIPFASVANPATDSDDIVLSDRPYACTKDPTYLVADKVIARIPDEQLNPSYDYLKVMLQNQIGWMNTKSTNVGWFQLVASVWKDIGDFMNTTFTMNNQNVAPPAGPGTISIEATKTKFAYLNLHGAQSTKFYYGQSGETYPIALQPVENNFNECLVFTEACYGGYIIGRNKESSIPMMALYSNAIGVISSTCIAYGPQSPPLQASDLLAKCFYNRVLAGNTTLGQALFNGKEDFARETILTYGSLNGSARKTLLEFHLYGCPGIKI